MPLPGNRPATKPGTRPGTLPETKPGTRPGSKPGTLPGTKPGTRPGTKPGTLPGTRPGTRPGTLPETKPGRPGNRPGGGNWVRPGGDKPSQLPIKRPGFGNNRPGGGLPGNRPGGGNNWVNIGGGNNVNVNINNNFRKNLNWSTNRRNWGYNPWWNRPSQLPWYGGCWGYGWNNNWRRHWHHHHHHYYRPWPGYYRGPSTGEMIGWGLVGWGIGNLIFNSGYQSYSNPYPAQPVQTVYKTEVTYQEPMTVVAEQTAPSDEEIARQMAENSASFIEKSQEAFKRNDYLASLDYATKAVAESPGDGALHEYRALVLFALGKYGEAAGVLNPVLASGPGWDWTTMVTLYDTQDTYVKQLQSLEAYVNGKSDAADGHFLLGYHYLVCGHLKNAAEQFRTASKIQPADSISTQLADLCEASTASGDDEDPEDAQPAGDVEAPGSIAADKLPGKWVSDKGEDGKVSLDLASDGKFTWTFSKEGREDSSFGGNYTINEEGLLVLDAEESQLVGAIEMPEDSSLTFLLAGGPPGDPGLSFKRM